MGKKWKSYLYVPALAMVLFATGMYLNNKEMTPKIDNQNQVYNLDEYFNKQETIVLDKRVTDDAHILMDQTIENSQQSSAQFILKLENDFVVVYRTLEPETCYMITGITSNDLPANTIEELKVGKEIIDEEELYFFLESHSS